MKANHILKINDILCSTWGYEQTNATFYKVIDTPSPAFVTIQKLETIRTESAPLAMAGTAMPGNLTNEVINKKVVKKYRADELPNAVKISNYETATKWNGQPVSVSWYG